MSRKSAECTIARRVIIIVISNSCARRWCVLSDGNEDRAKTGKRPKGKRRNGSTGVEESAKEGCRLHVCMCIRVCGPGNQEQRDARSQTYEEAIVHEHFAPVTSARQWPPLTRPVTVSLFADNAWKYAETHAGYPWSVDSRFPLIRALADRAEKKRGASSGKSSSLSVTRKSHRVSYLIPRVFREFNEREDRVIESVHYRPFRHSRGTYDVVNCCGKMKSCLFFSYIIMLIFRLEKIQN